MKTLTTSLFILAAGLVSLPAVAAGDIAAGKAVAEKHNCASCHGKDYRTAIDPTYPKLAGQHADYLRQALIEYRRGGTGPNGRANAIMNGMAKPLSDQDILDVAAYLHSLPGNLVLRK
ncbi:MAG: c-type cytochrome [Janthinobacterium lividum]